MREPHHRDEPPGRDAPADEQAIRAHLGPVEDVGGRGGPQARIMDLQRLVDRLPAADRERFERLFRVDVADALLVAPASMSDWIIRQFGGVEFAARQRIVKVTNLTTFEGSVFNALRSLRPAEARLDVDVQREIERSCGDPFCHPLTDTPEDVFGRISGAHSITASNVAKYDGFHGVVIFDRHSPLDLSRERFFDAVRTGMRWVEAAHRSDPEAKYPFFMWNCLWKSGASIVHGHAQVSIGRGMHYAKIEHLRRAALNYRARAGANYFDDLFAAHQMLGLGFANDRVRVHACLTPIKEKEVLISAETLSDRLLDTAYLALECFRQRLGVIAFNLAIYLPPIAASPEDWDGFPVQVRLVDRGDPINRTNDIGAMELYAASVIVSDPFQVADELKHYMASAQC